MRIQTPHFCGPQGELSRASERGSVEDDPGSAAVDVDSAAEVAATAPDPAAMDKELGMERNMPPLLPRKPPAMEAVSLAEPPTPTFTTPTKMCVDVAL